MGNLFSLFPYFQPLRIDLFVLIFGEKDADFARYIATFVLVTTYGFFILKKGHHNWKIYQRYKQKKAERGKESQQPEEKES